MIVMMMLMSSSLLFYLYFSVVVTYQSHVDVVGVAVGIRRVDSKGNAVGEYREQDEIFEGSGIIRAKEK